MKRRPVSGSMIEPKYQMWKKRMEKDHFEKFWPWIVWVVDRYISGEDEGKIK